MDRKNLSQGRQFGTVKVCHHLPVQGDNPYDKASGISPPVQTNKL